MRNVVRIETKTTEIVEPDLEIGNVVVFNEHGQWARLILPDGAYSLPNLSKCSPHATDYLTHMYGNDPRVMKSAKVYETLEEYMYSQKG